MRVRVRVGPALTLALSLTQVCNLLEFRDFNRWLLPLKGEQLPQNTWVLLIPALQLLLCTAVACVSCCITCGFTDAVDVVLNLNPNPNPNPYPNPNPNPNPSPNPNPNPNQVGRKGDAWDVPLLEFHWQLISEKVPAPRF